MKYDESEYPEVVAKMLVDAEGSSEVLTEAAVYTLGFPGGGALPAELMPRSPAELGLNEFTEDHAAIVLETVGAREEMKAQGEGSFSVSELLAMAAFESLPDGHELKQKVRDYLPPAFNQ